ncbi:MAG: ATP-dependent Clp protease proteolytic subunit [Oscillospiraceae bacterium]|nr:ATP-dependent Clp protease proteolytic subunit [Oscillospiraceae bacterium]
MNKTSSEQEKETQEKNETQQIVDFGSSLIRSSRGQIYCLTIVGQIEGHTVLGQNSKTTKYEHVIPLLASLEGAEDVDGILILLNTVGGDVEAGLAMAELIAGLKKPTVTLVLGGGHSIGVPLAVSGKVSMIVPSASMTIHPIRMTGMLIAAPQTYRYFERLQEQIVCFVEEHSRMERGKFLELMMNLGDMSSDVGSVVYGREAVRMGLIDRMGSISEAMDCLYGMIEREKQES